MDAPHGTGRSRQPQRRPSSRRLPRKIYVRRRVAAAVIVVVLVAVFIWIATLVGGDERPHEVKGTVSTTTSASTKNDAVTATTQPSTPATKQADQPTGAPDAVAATSVVPAPTTTIISEVPQKNSCKLDDLIITVTSDKPGYRPGDLPEFFMTVRNPTTADCVIDLNEAVLRFEVYDLATNRRVWSDVDCNSSEGAGTQTFPAGKEIYYKAVWSRTESAPNKCNDRPEAPIGGYYLHGLIGTNHSDAHTFNLG